MSVSRRSFLLLGAAAAASSLGGKIGRGLIGVARADDTRPHFLLSIHIAPGVDWTYLFDGRGPRVTDANLQQNYFLRNDASPNATTPDAFTEGKLRERTIATERTGAAALRSPLTDDLWRKHADVLSIVNGVVMLPDNASHEANTAYLHGNAPHGGAPIYAPSVGKRLGGTPLDAVIVREQWPFSPPPSNLAGSADLSLDELGAVAGSLQSGADLDESSPAWKHIVARADANAAGPGLFAVGSQNLAQSLRRTNATAAAFAAAGEVGSEGSGRLLDAATTALTLFAGGVTRVATIIDRGPLDAHDSVMAAAQPRTYAAIANQLDAIIDLLKAAMYFEPNGRATPFIELTTFIVSSEFGRSARALAFAGSVGATGTDHNSFNNAALVGGKGIAGGLVVGGTDLQDCDASGKYVGVSGAHLEKNRALDLPMGAPFDFRAQRVRTDLPSAWSAEDYIGMPSVTNTILDCFGVPQSEQYELNGRPAPILSVLRRGRG